MCSTVGTWLKNEATLRAYSATRGPGAVMTRLTEVLIAGASFFVPSVPPALSHPMQPPPPSGSGAGGASTP